MAIHFTVIARESDGLYLCASMEDEASILEQFRTRATSIIKRASATRNTSGDPHINIEDPPNYFILKHHEGVIYLVCASNTMSKSTAVSYLDEIQREFSNTYDALAIKAAARPYAFVNFENFILSTKAQFIDARAKNNMSRVSKQLKEVHSICTKSIEEMMGREARLQAAAQQSGHLLSESKKMKNRTAELRRKMLMKKWAPVIVLAVIMALFIYYRFFWFPSDSTSS